LRVGEYVAKEVDTSRVCNYVHGGRGGGGRNIFFQEAIVTAWRELWEESVSHYLTRITSAHAVMSLREVSANSWTQISEITEIVIM